jgi:PAS domain S-box-containing protein
MSLKTGMRPEDLSPTQDCVDQWRRLYRRALSEGSFTTDYVADAGSLTLQLTLNLLKRDGKVFGISVFGKDITERKRAEALLSESEERFRATFENAGAGMALVDMQGHCLKSNPALRQMLGYNEEELGRLAFTEYTHPDDRALDWGLFGELTAGKLNRYEIEKRFLKKGGGLVWGLLTSSQVKDEHGRPLYGVGMVQDITERKRAEEALRESEERYRRLFEVESDAILVVEVDTGRILDVNAAALDLYGYSREEFRCLTAEQVSAEPEKTRAAIAEEWMHFQFRWHRKKDGTVFPVEITANNFFDQGRKIHVGAIRDITERQRAAEELRRTRFSVEHASDAITWVDSQSRIVYANEAACRSLGYSREELLSLRIPDIDRQMPDVVWRTHWEELKARGAMTFESQNVSKQGTAFPVKVSANYLEFDGKEYCFAFVRDITQRKWAEEQLRKLSRAVEQSPESVVITDVQGNIEYVNPKFTQLTGYTFEEATGQNPRILKSGMVPAATYRELWQTVLCGGEWRGEFANKKKNGEVYWESASIVPIRGSGGAITHFLAVKEDITERKQGEMALREAETMLRFFVQHAPAPIAMLDREMRYLVVSRRWITDFRLGDREIRGLSHYEAFPEITERWKEIHRRCLAGAVENCAEDRFARLDGSADWVRWEIRPWRRIDNSIGGIIIFSELITERKRAEEERQRSLVQLRALAGQLQNTREEERKRVAREIHDQLGQALTAIKMDLSSWLRELPAGKNQPTKRTASILKLVDESIQTVRRISTELRPGILDDLGLVAALEWAGEDFQARTGTTCRLDLPVDDIAVNPEPATAIFRIFQETLTNVARHADATAVEVRLSKEDSDLTLEVHDNGKGIPEDKLSNGESLGILGMRERTLLLGGELTISGPPGNGTTVRVRIPVTPSESAGISRQRQLFSSSGRKGGDSEQ